VVVVVVVTGCGIVFLVGTAVLVVSIRIATTADGAGVLIILMIVGDDVVAVGCSSVHQGRLTEWNSTPIIGTSLLPTG
jgi:hypothetical protein